MKEPLFSKFKEMNERLIFLWFIRLSEIHLLYSFIELTKNVQNYSLSCYTESEKNYLFTEHKEWNRMGIHLKWSALL